MNNKKFQKSLFGLVFFEHITKIQKENIFIHHFSTSK